jgi:protein-arginine kinase activator protein McsA
MDVMQGFQVSPGCCYVCGTSDQSRYRADMGELYTARRTRLYVCETCITAAAKKIADLKGDPWLSVAEIQQMSAVAAESANWQHRAEEAEAKLASFAAALEGAGT